MPRRKRLDRPAIMRGRVIEPELTEDEIDLKYGKILFGKIGDLRIECEDDDNEVAANEIVFENRSFVIRKELNATQLKNDVDTISQLTYSIVVEDGKEYLYLAYRSHSPIDRAKLRLFDRVVRTFFLSNKGNMLDMPDDEMDHCAVEESQRIDNGGAALADDESAHADNGLLDANEIANGTDMVSELYNRLRQAHFEHDQLITMDAPVQHAAMKATLTSYQVAAVRWMMHRELCYIEAPLYKPVFRRWPPLVDDGKEKFVYNSYTFSFCEVEQPAIVLPSGGILADEMGLGKTVEMLAVVLLNKRPQGDLAKRKKESRDDDDVQYVSDSASDRDSDSDVEYDDNGRFGDHDFEMPLVKRRKLRYVSVKCICHSSDYAPRDRLIECSKCWLRQHRLCVLRHVTIDFDETTYICPQCWNKEEVIKTTATIIVSPRSIKMQWFHEIDKHIDAANLKVLVYEGVSNGNWMSPVDMSAYDLVLADYETMHSEIKFVNASQVHRVNRAPPLFLKPISPLLKLEWWRVCLDEAQMVGGTVSNAAKLVGQLETTHRWAITGTPIDKSINDLSNLFRFLDYRNSHVLKCACEKYMADESDELIDMLWPIMWRTCKSEDILNEIAIPKQTEIVHYITPSDLELYFYNEQFVSCYEAFEEKANKLLMQQQERRLLSELSPNILKLLMEPLRKIRKDCSMPSILQKNDQRTNKNLLRPENLLQHLVSNTEIKAKSELRTIASSLNGQAALHIIQNNNAAAIQKYKTVLKWAADYSENVSVDSLLQVHALHNLLTIGSGLAPDDVTKYREQLKWMEQKYIDPSAQLVAKIKGEQKKYTDRVEECRQEFIDNEYTWWATMLADSERSDHLMVRVFSELMEKDAFSNARGLSLALSKWMDDVNADRDGVYKLFDKLTYFTDNIKALPLLEPTVREKIQKLVETALECHLDPHSGRHRNQRKQPKVCELCVAKQQLEKYERSIQPEKKHEKIDRDKQKTERKTKDWKVSHMEKILRILQTQSRQFEMNEDLQNDAKNHLKLMEALHAEFTELSQLWVEVNHTVSLYDEIEMCKSRLLVYDPIYDPAENETDQTEPGQTAARQTEASQTEKGQKSAKTANLYISKYEVEENMVMMGEQLKRSELEFVRKMGRLKYLNHLKKSKELEECPICCNPPLEKYMVLECGHHMCMVCGIHWMEKSMAGSILTCSICRHQQRKKNLYYVTLTTHEKLTNSSSKMEQIVQTVIKLKAEDERVKIVIFSHYPDILSILEGELLQNKVEYRSRTSAFAKALAQFKDPSLNVTCLLMPLQYGSKGLNLTEATHVFLVEPILNPGEQLQAIGRVHRMGQTRPTFVHRFVVKSTIEETIYEQSKCDIWAYKNWTIDNLRKLFRGGE